MMDSIVIRAPITPAAIQEAAANAAAINANVATVGTEPAGPGATHIAKGRIAEASPRNSAPSAINTASTPQPVTPITPGMTALATTAAISITRVVIIATIQPLSVPAVEEHVAKQGESAALA